MKTHWKYAEQLGTVLGLNHDSSYQHELAAISTALLAAEQRGIERSAEVAANVYNDFMGMEHRHAICANATPHIRALAQGGGEGEVRETKKGETK